MAAVVDPAEDADKRRIPPLNEFECAAYFSLPIDMGREKFVSGRNMITCINKRFPAYAVNYFLTPTSGSFFSPLRGASSFTKF